MSDIERWWRVSSALVWVLVAANAYIGKPFTFLRVLWVVACIAIAGAVLVGAVQS